MGLTNRKYYNRTMLTDWELLKATEEKDLDDYDYFIPPDKEVYTDTKKLL